MEDHTQMSWKEDNFITQLHNSVDNVTLAVGQALSHPTEQTILQAQNSIEHADRAFANALKNHGNSEPVSTLQEQLNQNKEKLNQLH
ncbi:hypothetical protein [Paenisporosarcina sp. TG20]|uniref:hypothetical protein n=1 Tax=Paenisporosarcina sp. TG20 TaxID=1211706 RepID=UPI0002FA16EF|nr:hypothetical protein [Paenisporosarcina sp. TG20]